MYQQHYQATAFGEQESRLWLGFATIRVIETKGYERILTRVFHKQWMRLVH